MPKCDTEGCEKPAKLAWVSAKEPDTEHKGCYECCEKLPNGSYQMWAVKE